MISSFYVHDNCWVGSLPLIPAAGSIGAEKVAGSLPSESFGRRIRSHPEESWYRDGQSLGKLVAVRRRLSAGL